MASALERYYDGIGNVVLRDEDGNPSVFVRHPKQLSSEFDPSLPEHIHPAFTCGRDGSNNVIEDAAVLIGKYQSSQIVPGGRYYSLPNVSPTYESYESNMANMRWMAGDIYTTGITIADYGLMVLMAHQRGIDQYREGNTYFGACSASAGDAYYVGAQVAVGAVRVYHGYEYVCLKAHTTSADLLPDDAPGYWQRGKKVGGTPVMELIDKTVTADVYHNYADKYYRARLTLTGSGPKSWYAYGDPTQEADVCGNQRIRICDLRIDNGEIRIIPYNAAGDGRVNPTDSSLYQAILPHSNDNGFSFVAPGTDGTVHYDRASNGRIMLKAGSSSYDGEVGCAFNQIEVDTNSLPYVPSILYELGLAPIPGTRLNHQWVVNPHRTGRIICFGSRFTEGSSGSALRLEHNIDTSKSLFVGTRMRARELAAS